MSSWAIRTLRRVATDLRSYQDGRRIPLGVVDAFTISLELVYLITGDQEYEVVRQALRFLRKLQDEPCPTHENHTPPLLHTGYVGRLKFEISCGQLTFLIESRFSAPQIAYPSALSGEEWLNMDCQ